MDLSGNTFWEFKDHQNGNRFRRIVKYKNPTHHSDIKISPQWHQWLRQVRKAPPSITEQQQDVTRVQTLRVLARIADEKWANKLSFLENPIDQPKSTTTPKEPGSEAGVAQTGGERGAKSMTGSGPEAMRASGASKSRDPSDQWQPEMWAPKPCPERR
ncbi:MAG: hypothetical protein M1840_009160 [Geoglossum simile]|nr:MAG: hypothetical protein M1840_009160 [Geoglossum simile]